MAKENHPNTGERHQGRSEMAHQAKETAEELGEKARHQVTSQLDRQRERGAEQLGTMSSALRRTSSSLREEQEEAVAGYVEQAADQADRLSEYLRTHSAGEMYSEVERYARRQPTVFLGGALLAGFLGARFLKSSSPERRRRPRRGRQYAGGTPERSLREPQREGYAPVHGTSGAEMPDPSSPSAPATASALEEEGSAGTRTEEQQRR